MWSPSVLAGTGKEPPFSTQIFNSFRDIPIGIVGYSCLIVGGLGALAGRAWGRRLIRGTCLGVVASQLVLGVLMAVLFLPVLNATADGKLILPMLIGSALGLVVSIVLYAVLWILAREEPSQPNSLAGDTAEQRADVA